MTNPYRYASPDTRLRHIAYARDREQERAAELDEFDNQRLLGIQGEMEVEQGRAADLDQRDSVRQGLDFERQRGADLDKRGVPPVSEWMPQRDEAAEPIPMSPSGLAATVSRGLSLDDRKKLGLAFGHYRDIGLADLERENQRKVALGYPPLSEEDVIERAWQRAVADVEAPAPGALEFTAKMAGVPFTLPSALMELSHEKVGEPVAEALVPGDTPIVEKPLSYVTDPATVALLGVPAFRAGRAGIRGLRAAGVTRGVGAKPMAEADILGSRFADVAGRGRAVDIAAGARGTPGELRTMVEEAATYGAKPRPAPAAGGFPQADVVVGGALARLTNIIKQTKPLRAEAEEFKSEALRRKAAALRDVQAGRGGEAGFYAGRGTLRGPNLPTPSGEAVRGQFSQQEVDALVNHPLSHPAATARPLEAANAQAALLDTLSGQLPTKGQIGLLERYFGTEFAAAVRSNRPLGAKGWETLVDLYHLPRTVMASIDNSFPLRQGVMTITRHPKEWFGNLPESFRSGFSANRAQLMDDAMRTDATVIQTGYGPRTVSELAEEGGLFRARIEGVVMSEREEFFQSNLAKRIPFLGAGVRWSERAYVTYGNKLRHDIFKNTLLSWQSPRGGVVQITPKKVRALANLINRMTGRGTLGPLNQYGPELAAGFFAPKFAVSRPQAFLQLFNWQNPEVARMAASEIVSFVALGTSVLSLMKLSGAADVELDPRSADFGKIKLGNTRIDFWGGNVQWARLVTQLQQGKRKTSDGIVVASSEIDNALRFVRYKAHPSPGTVVDLLLGETAIGEKFPPTGAAEISEAVFERIAPMAIQDLVSAIEQQGMSGFLFGTPAFGGVGVQSYETKQEAFERVTGQKWSETPRFRRDELIRASPELQRFEGGEPTAGEEIREDRGAELLPLAQAVLAGTPGAAQSYHENRSGIMTKFAGVSENEFGDMDIPIVGKDMELLDQYYSVNFLADLDGNGIPGDDEDTRMALETQDEFFQQLSPAVQDAMKNPANFFPQTEVQGAERRRNDALEKLRHLFDEIPKYSKETVEGSEKIDDFVRYTRQQQDEGIHEHGEERWGWSLPKLAIQLGKERNDRALGQAASWALSRNIKWNDEYNDYLIENQEVIAPFFPRMNQRVIFRSPGVLSDEIWKEVNLPQQAPGVPTMPEALAAFKS